MFSSLYVHFLGFIVSRDRVSVDLDKVKAIREWPTPSMIYEAMSFHSLSTFYRRFVGEFSTITAPITVCLKKEEIKWTKSATKSFKKIKEKFTIALVLRLHDFSKVFDIACDDRV